MGGTAASVNGSEDRFPRLLSTKEIELFQFAQGLSPIPLSLGRWGFIVLEITVKQILSAYLPFGRVSWLRRCAQPLLIQSSSE